MIRISQLKLSITHTSDELKRAVLRELKITEKQLCSFRVIKRSVDARKKPELKYIYSLEVQVKDEKNVLKSCRSKNAEISEKRIYQIPESGSRKMKERPVIIGTGPAGLFCGLLLARAGYRPVLLERGESVEKRSMTVEEFWKGQKLSESTNVQFGEGGAGTFSDGKLNTLVKDAYGRNHFVLETFVGAGAAEEILYVNKPHIGTDVLQQVVKTMREEILSLGGEVKFCCQMQDIIIKNDELHSIRTSDGQEIPADVLVLAIGHSARDTFYMLSEKALILQPKAFAVGLRIEHPQSMINVCQYGAARTRPYMAADYKLAENLANGRGVYSFCMCPGGYVVNASSEKDMIAVNGMSYQKRDGKNANSAIVVTVTPEDYGKEGCFGGIKFQQKLEKAAYLAGGGNIPVQLYGDFKEGRVSTGFGDITPAIKGGVQFADLRNCLPEFISESIDQGIEAFGRKISGFDRADALLSGVESRTSSPVRIVRGEGFESNIRGIYPCGEGAGYAGGITSAAMDGMKVAEAVIKKFCPFT